MRLDLYAVIDSYAVRTLAVSVSKRQHARSRPLGAALAAGHSAVDPARYSRATKAHALAVSRDSLQEASAVERPRHARSKQMAIWLCLQQVCIESHVVKFAGQTYGAPHPLPPTPSGNGRGTCVATTRRSCRTSAQRCAAKRVLGLTRCLDLRSHSWHVEDD